MFDECAEIINKAFCVDNERLKNHEKSLQRINRSKLMSPSLPRSRGQFDKADARRSSLDHSSLTFKMAGRHESVPDLQGNGRMSVQNFRPVERPATVLSATNADKPCTSLLSGLGRTHNSIESMS